MKTRIRFFSSLVVFFAIILITKLFFLQILNAETYSKKADKQYITPASNIFERGSIFFTAKNGGRVSAATQKLGFKLVIKPSSIVDELSIYEQLSRIIPLNKDKFLKQAKKKNDPYEEVAHKLTKKEADDINALNLKGVSIYKEKWRFYPGGNLASHSLGFVAWGGPAAVSTQVGAGRDMLSGRYGLERYYNDILDRNAADKFYINFFAEIFSKISTLFQKSDKKEGNIITSIEPSVQGLFEKELRAIIEKWQADSAGGIIINPFSGSIYALAHLPDFDINNFSKVSDPIIFSNPLVENVFEYGSILKPLTMAAGLDAGVVTASTTYNDLGYVIVDDRTIHNFDKKGRGIVNMQEVISQSLNTGAVFVMQQLGREKFRNYMLAYGLGERTGVDLPNETFGLVGNLKSPRMIEYATVAFGQGIAITPMEAVRAFSVLANGGTLITPHIVKEIEYKDGTSTQPFPLLSTGESGKGGEGEQSRRVLSKDSSEEITRMLVDVIDNAIEGGALKIDHYSIAAKTGTAQIAKVEGGGYYENKFFHSFFGYFPAFDPEFLVLLYVVNPKGVRFASQTLVKPFMDTVKFLISYYDIVPDR